MYMFRKHTKTVALWVNVIKQNSIQPPTNIQYITIACSWQMIFNFGKRKCLHTGPGNTGVNYEMGGTILSKTVKEKDLGVTMNANMKVSEQCRIAVSKGNQDIEWL